jgi:hypothetical protein
MVYHQVVNRIAWLTAAAALFLPPLSAAQTVVTRVSPLPAGFNTAALAAPSIGFMTAAPALSPALAAPSALMAPLAAAPRAAAAPAAVAAPVLSAAPAAAAATPRRAASLAAALPLAAVVATAHAQPGSAVAVPASPEDSAAAAARLSAFFDGAAERAGSDEVQTALDAVVDGHASPEFVARVRAHMARTIPAPVLHELAQGGYKIHIDERIRQGREDLHEDNDYTGGFHSYGPQGKFIIIAEKIKHKKSGEWRANGVWENAIDHEIGHAVAYLLGERAAVAAEKAGDKDQAKWYAEKGLSENPEFRDAWRQDFEAMPGAVKAEAPEGAPVNDFYYFVHPDENGWYQRARQETWAEGFDILLRGERSRFNYDNFSKYFPRSMAVLHRLLEAEYGAGLNGPSAPAPAPALPRPSAPAP